MPVVQDSWRETPGCGLGSIWPARKQIPSLCLYETAAKIGDSFPEGTALAEGCPSGPAEALVTVLSLFPLCWVRGEAGGGAAQCVFANRVPHPCCRLRPVDVEFMKALHEKVNIVPLIAKADCLIPSEIRKLKERVRCSFCTVIP